jgi:hypothetical protein
MMEHPNCQPLTVVSEAELKEMEALEKCDGGIHKSICVCFSQPQPFSPIDRKKSVSLDFGLVSFWLSRMFEAYENLSLPCFQLQLKCF